MLYMYDTMHSRFSKKKVIEQSACTARIHAGKLNNIKPIRKRKLAQRNVEWWVLHLTLLSRDTWHPVQKHLNCSAQSVNIHSYCNLKPLNNRLPSKYLVQMMGIPSLDWQPHPNAGRQALLPNFQCCMQNTSLSPTCWKIGLEMGLRTMLPLKLR